MVRSNNLPRRGVPAAQRKRSVLQIDLIQRFLLVCEGTQTEPNYFRRFRVPTNVVEIKGLAYDPLRLVQEAIELQQTTKPKYDQVWCVFDRDSVTLQRFNEALDLARRKKIQVAYTNEAFELWFLLHYDLYTTGISRSEYSTKLKDKLGHPYEKNSTELYNELQQFQDKAIQHAEHLLSLYNISDPAKDNPSTTVHLLVKELRKYARP